MRRPIILSVILFAAIICLAVLYFNNLSTPGSRTTNVLRSIPDNAALVFRFNNEESFYEIYNGNKLFAAVIGEKQLTELDTLRKEFLKEDLMRSFFDDQDVFISLHPEKGNTIGLLLSTSVSKDFDASNFDKLVAGNSQLQFKPKNYGSIKGYDVYSPKLKRHFYLVCKEKGIYSGSFSSDVIENLINYSPQKDKENFIQLPQKQTTNSLGNLYINYAQLNPLFDKLMKNRYNDIFKSYRMFPALGVLDLNFKSDALMFSGFTETAPVKGSGFLSLFLGQQPMVTKLVDIFPSTTAYSLSFAVSDITKFENDLAAWQEKAGLRPERDTLFKKIQTETGIKLSSEFNKALSNEFAVVTTRFMEKLAIISLKDGSALRPVMYNISNMDSEEIGQIKFNKVPFFLLGDAFTAFNHPWFMIVDNNLILANTKNELMSYRDTYFNNKFQYKNPAYKEFNELTTQRSNVSWYINFKNSQAILKRDLNNNFYKAFSENEPGWKNFYAASYQLSATDKNFYSVFCLNLNQADTIATSK